MIFFFSYFWVAMMFQPNQIADDLKKNGGYIPGVRPGKPTAEFLDFTMSRLTFAGAVFLIIVAILPQMFSRMLSVPYITATVLRRHEPAHHRGCHPRHDAPDRDAPAPAALRRFPAQGPYQGRGVQLGRNINEGEPARQSTLVMLCVGAALLLICGLASR